MLLGFAFCPTTSMVDRGGMVLGSPVGIPSAHVNEGLLPLVQLHPCARWVNVWQQLKHVGMMAKAKESVFQDGTISLPG